MDQACTAPGLGAQNPAVTPKCCCHHYPQLLLRHKGSLLGNSEERRVFYRALHQFLVSQWLLSDLDGTGRLWARSHAGQCQKWMSVGFPCCAEHPAPKLFMNHRGSRELHCGFSVPVVAQAALTCSVQPVVSIGD